MTVVPVVALRVPPVAVQVTARLLVPVTVAVMVWVVPRITWAELGLRETAMDGTTVMAVLAVLRESAWLVAVT